MKPNISSVTNTAVTIFSPLHNSLKINQYKHQTTHNYLTQEEVCLHVMDPQSTTCYHACLVVSPTVHLVLWPGKQCLQAVTEGCRKEVTSGWSPVCYLPTTCNTQGWLYSHSSIPPMQWITATILSPKLSTYFILHATSNQLFHSITKSIWTPHATTKKLSQKISMTHQYSKLAIVLSHIKSQQFHNVS